jgi:hypothetical protein
MADPIKITYCFDFDNGRDITYLVRLDRGTLHLISEEIEDTPEWVDLSYKKCTNCPLSETDNKYCPVALNVVHITKKFSDVISHKKVFISVTTEERTYKKRTTVEEALSSLMGIIMVTSGCPILDHLKPMARFHLPFSSAVETTIRALSMYLLAQFLVKKDTDTHTINFDLDDLEIIYSQIKEVNNDFSIRLSKAGKKDANLSALSNLDSNATLATMTIEDTLSELKQYYTAYM